MAKRLWQIADIIDVLDAYMPPPKKRGPYKKEMPSSIPTQVTKFVAALLAGIVLLICLWEFVNWWFDGLF